MRPDLPQPTHGLEDEETLRRWKQLGRPCFKDLPRGFSAAIDRQTVCSSIVREICNVWRKINCATFVTDEQNALSLCPAKGRRNFLAVRIPCVSVVRTHPHMYPQRSTPLDVYSDMYVQGEVLLCVMKCETW